MFSESTSRRATSAPLRWLKQTSPTRSLSFAARTRACGRGIEEGTPSRPKLDHLVRFAGIRSASPKSARLELANFPK